MRKPPHKPTRLTRNSAQAAAERLRLALDLYATGEALMRANLRRRFPRAGAAEIERRLVAWHRDRPGARFGDAVGRPVRRLRAGR